jgi:hypothetical protein
MIFSVRNGVIGLMELEYLALLIFKPEINDHIEHCFLKNAKFFC